MLLCITTQPVIAWGGLTHYSINRDAGKDSTEELSAAIAPDAFHDFYYGNSGLGAFVHEELPGVLYGLLDIPLRNVSVDDSQKRWATGWMTHTTADRASHGTYLSGSPYIDPNNYLSAVGADTLEKHIMAEFGADILSYWFHEGTITAYIVIYPDQVGDAFEDYDSNHNTNYAAEYDPCRYMGAFVLLFATIWTEQVVIDFGQDKKLQFTDWRFLVWAYSNYYNKGYKIYYPCAVDNVTELILCSSSFNPTYEQSTDSPDVLPIKSEVHHAESVKIKMDVGKKLIDDGLIMPHKEFNARSGAVTISFKQAVSDKELAKAYEQYLEEAYEKHTGKKAKFLDEVISRKKPVTIRDIKKAHPDLYQKLIEEGVIGENKIDR